MSPYLSSVPGSSMNEGFTPISKDPQFTCPLSLCFVPGCAFQPQALCSHRCSVNTSSAAQWGRQSHFPAKSAHGRNTVVWGIGLHTVGAPRFFFFKMFSSSLLRHCLSSRPWSDCSLFAKWSYFLYQGIFPGALQKGLWGIKITSGQTSGDRNCEVKLKMYSIK